MNYKTAKRKLKALEIPPAVSVQSPKLQISFHNLEHISPTAARQLIGRAKRMFGIKKVEKEGDESFVYWQGENETITLLFYGYLGVNCKRMEYDVIVPFQKAIEAHKETRYKVICN